MRLSAKVALLYLETLGTDADSVNVRVSPSEPTLRSRA